jgi:hypothetical protein
MGQCHFAMSVSRKHLEIMMRGKTLSKFVLCAQAGDKDWLPVASVL